KDLTAVTGGGNPRGAVDIDPDVSLAGHRGLAGMDTHAPAGWPLAARIARPRRRQRVGRSCERYEERVSLCFHLDTAVARELSAQRMTVTGQHLRVLVAPALQPPRRALDVSEQKRDGALRE